METGNATKAAIAAGYSAKTAHSIGSENLKKKEIGDRLAEMRADLATTVGVTPVMMALELKKIALSNVTNIRDGWMTLKDFEDLPDEVKACISEVHTSERDTPMGSVTQVKVKFHDKLRAIADLNKLLNFNPAEKHEHTGKDGGPIDQNVRHAVVFEDMSNGNPPTV